MSEDRDKRIGNLADDDAPKTDVEAHVKKRDANDEGTADDAGENDVEAHVKSHRS